LIVVTGGCQCGFLRYEASGVPFGETLCHCSLCRRTTGAPAVAWFSVRPRDFRFTEGKPSRYASSETGTRSFCPQCGAQVTFQNTAHPGELDVTTASLDDPDATPPKDQTWVSSRVRWMDDVPSLTSYPRLRSEGRA
jgi:hypothetical protein